MRRTVGIAVVGLVLSLAGVSRAEKPSAATTPARRLEICGAAFDEAQAKHRANKLVEAHTLYGTCADPACPAKIKDECTKRLDAVEQATPTVTIVVRDAAGKDLPATITVDNEPWSGPPGEASVIDPGQHEVIAHVQGEAAARKATITVAEGEKSRVIALGASSGGEVASPSRAPTAAIEEKPSLVGPIVLGSAGVVALLGGVGLLVIAGGELEARDEQRAKAANPSPGTSAEQIRAFNDSAASHENAAESTRLLGFVVGGAGVALLGGAVLWYVLSKPEPSAQLKPAAQPKPAARAGLTGVHVVANARGVGFTF